MKSMRHMNPLIDTRRPRHRERVGVNPPGFIWRPIEGAGTYRLEVSRSRRFDDASVRGFAVSGRTLFVPAEPFEPGRWFWRWSANGTWSRVFEFDLLDDAAEVKIAGAAEAVAREAHPRMMVRAEAVESLRARWKDEKPDSLARVVARAERLLAEPHSMDEPPFLPSRSEDYNRAHVIWRQAMNDSRAFCLGARDLAYAHLVTGDRRYADAVSQRLDSLSRWDPDGSTAISHNDEPHMSVINWCPFALDWTYDALDAGARERFIAHLARRADNTLAHHARLDYAVNPISNHAGRMLPFLGNCALALAGHHPNAGRWLAHVLELTVSMYPAWGAEAGGWAQGFSYGGAYVRMGLEFLYSLRTALGLDLYRKPFFRSHARWYALCLPAYAWQNPFGDGGERDFAKQNAAVITRHLSAMTGDAACAQYAARCEATLKDPASDDPLVALAEGAGRCGPAALGWDPSCTGEGACATQDALPTSECFDDVGWVAMRRDLEHPEDDICLVLKSSPYGPVSHSHGDQNAFVLSAWGKPLLVRSGYYTGYDSPHHRNWIRQTKAHNAVTVGGVGQWVDCFDAVGRIAAFKRSRDFTWACGDASRAYGERLTRFRRHVVFVDRRYFLVVDDLESPVDTTFDWHLHSLERMEMDAGLRQVRFAREDATLDVRFVTEWDLRFYRTDQFDVPNDDVERGPYPAQWHFRATTVPVSRRARVGMLLIPNRASRPETFEVEPVKGEAFFGTAVTHDGTRDVFLIASGDGPIIHGSRTFDALAVWMRGDEVKLEI